MAKEKAQQAVSEPAVLEVPEESTEAGQKGKRLTDKQILALEKELGIKRQTAVIDKQRVEIGEGLYFDDILGEDPTEVEAAEARAQFSWVTVTIDLGEQADRITFDRTQYFHGHTYKVRRYKEAGLNETMYNSLRHDAEVNGRARGLRNVKKNYRMGRDARAVPQN